MRLGQHRAAAAMQGALVLLDRSTGLPLDASYSYSSSWLSPPTSKLPPSPPFDEERSGQTSLETRPPLLRSQLQGTFDGGEARIQRAVCVCAEVCTCVRASLRTWRQIS